MEMYTLRQRRTSDVRAYLSSDLCVGLFIELTFDAPTELIKWLLDVYTQTSPRSHTRINGSILSCHNLIIIQDV